MSLAWVDALVWSSGWLALAAALLTAAAARALGTEPAPAAFALACGGTLAIYVIDRVRDLPRDRTTAPARAAFVERNLRGLLALGAAGGALGAGAAFALGPRALALAMVIGALGLAHRRLKRWSAVKPVYLTFAWTAVPVGLAAGPGGGRHLAAVAGVIAAALLANVALSNLRDREALAARYGPRRTLRFAGLVAAAGSLAALLGPAPVQPLAAIPAAMLGAVLGFRPTERYGGLVVDGALVVGAALALAWPAA